MVMKLLMYGTTIIKPVETDTIVKGNRDDLKTICQTFIITLIQ